MLNRNSSLSLLVLLFVFITATAQTRSPEDRVRIDSNLVLMDAVVTRNGNPVKDLKPSDFEIFEDGRRQQITSFAYVPNEKRRTVALVVDDYGLSERSMADIRKQLRTFIDQNLQAGDQVAIVLTSVADKSTTLQFTNDKSVLDRDLERLVWNRCSRVGVGANPNLNEPSTAACDPSVATPKDSQRAVRSIVEAMNKLPGRKSLVLFSDNPPLSKNDTDGLNKLTETAVRSSVVLYAVDPGSFYVSSLTPGNYYTSTPGPLQAEEYKVALYLRSTAIDRSRKAAKLMVEKTGGFFVKDQKLFQLDDILQDQSGYYLIGYHPTANTFNNRSHTFKARVKKRGMTVRTRSGFFGVTDQEAQRLK